MFAGSAAAIILIFTNPMLALFEDQQLIVDKLRKSIVSGHNAPLLVSPTGSGKTVIFSFLVRRMAENGLRSIILAHRQELLRQISGTLKSFMAPHALILAGERTPRNKMISVGSVFTCARRLKKITPPDYVVLDEAHHAIEGSTWRKCIDFWRLINPALRVIGVTATPIRLSGEGLDKTFDDLILGPTTDDLIKAGRLSDYALFRAGNTDTSGLHMRGGDYVRSEAAALMDKPSITGDAIAHYRKHLDGRPSIAFCVSVEHAQSVAESFRAAGYRAASIDGKMDKLARRLIVREFKRGRLNVLTSCDLISEGFDAPGAHGGLLLRPTESEGLYLQQVGRLLRKHPGKDRAIILDHVGNSRRHGMPCAIREWSLAGRKKVKRKDPDDIQVRECKTCGACSPAHATHCRECGEEFPIQPRKVAEREGELEETQEGKGIPFRRLQGMAEDKDALVKLGKMRGMRNPHGWADHVLRARAAKQRRAG